MPNPDYVYRADDFASNELRENIRSWGIELGFQQIGFSEGKLETDEAHLLNWLAKGQHGEMTYMQTHGTMRSRPQDLVAGTLSIISVRMDYLPPAVADTQTILDDPNTAFISRYALGRDYHKLLRARLQKLADRIQQQIGPFGYRAFTDSAPVLEKALARNAGLGWIGKHSNLIHPKTGSWFFLGELYTDLKFAPDQAHTDHCGTCERCIEVCPTQAIVAPYRVDARRCISYLTIELHGAIPIEFRRPMGNRIYGCDDCQLVCPWNKFAKVTAEKDFRARHKLDQISLLELFAWSEDQFLQNTEGSAIRRIGYERWLRNIAVALGNAPSSPAIITALEEKLLYPSELLREHVQWALLQHTTNIQD